jgi:hypothetical protein
LSGIAPVDFKDYTAKFEQKKEEPAYVDPLTRWPLRGLSYTNEIGAAINPVAPKLGTLLWFPTMMYFGADIYDKYKNDKTLYNPNGYRGTQQAIFQALSGLILPTTAVFTGQQIVSRLTPKKVKHKKAVTLKTIGGFAALALAINPIDRFVENVIIKKFVRPGLLRLDHKQVEQYKDKVLIK